VDLRHQPATWVHAVKDEVERAAVVPVDSLAQFIDFGVVHEPTLNQEQVVFQKREHIRSDGLCVRPSAAREDPMDVAVAEGHPALARWRVSCDGQKDEDCRKSRKGLVDTPEISRKLIVVLAGMDFVLDGDYEAWLLADDQ
jgi:hypothetical protein